MNLFLFLPDWAPNMHPLVVHFPIALFVTGVLIDLLQLVRPFRDRLDLTALVLYILGTLGGVAAWFTGKAALQSVPLGIEAQRLAASHEFWAGYTVLFFIGFTLVRLMLQLFGEDRQLLFRMAMPLLGLAGVALLWQTAELGKRLVYEHGVGVRGMEPSADVIDFSEYSRFDADEGEWSWIAGQNAAEVFFDEFQVLGPGAGALQWHTRRNEQGYFLSLQTNSSDPVFLVREEPVRDVSMEWEFRMDEFEGYAGLVHFFLNPEQFMFLDYNSHEMRIGMVEAPHARILDAGQRAPQEWNVQRFAVDGSHFYGYAGFDMVAHGHTRPWGQEYSGFMLQGNGTLDLRRIQLIRIGGYGEHGHFHDQDQDQDHDQDQDQDHSHSDDHSQDNSNDHDHPHVH